MIFWTWRSYFIRWQIFENKVWCPVSKKRTKYFHFLLSLAYPIDRLDWALFSVVILFHHLFPLLEKVEIQVFILPHNFPAVLIIFVGQGGAGRGTTPSPRGRAPIPVTVASRSFSLCLLFKCKTGPITLNGYTCISILCHLKRKKLNLDKKVVKFLPVNYHCYADF